MKVGDDMKLIFHNSILFFLANLKGFYETTMGASNWENVCKSFLCFLPQILIDEILLTTSIYFSFARYQKVHGEIDPNSSHYKMVINL
jgi:hypothetical protein